MPRRRIGRYTVIGLLGEGATGKVYLAEQTEPLRRTVAIKVLEAVERSDRIFARFEVERLALAVMDHPSIAKVHDAGITDDGHPYVVMERVDGKPIGQYCDEQRLTIRERVELFGDACLAVHHAHQKGLIHRDLKPSHMLVMEVDGRPRLRVIDFGIAMALERDSHLDIGRDDAEVVGTPGYMSPEQMEGSSDIDTRSDIYSLGVILYELLVGVPPFEPGRRRGWAAVAAQLADLPTPTRRLTSLEDTQETLASHRSTTPRGLKKALSGDLDSIVTRAMSKDRVDRYDTARDLWLDLGRYLAFEPVEAREGGPAYRAGRFARRHRVGVAFAGLTAVGVVAFAATAVAQATRVAQARDEAEARRSQAEGLIDFMLTDLHERLQPLGRLDIMDAVGAQALDYLGATPEQDIDDEELFRRVTATQQIGQVRLDQGDLPAAREAFQAALALNVGLAERSPDNTDWQLGLGASHYWVGFVDYLMADHAAALDQMGQYLDITDALVARDPTNPIFRRERAYAHSNIGSVLQASGDPDGALVEFTAMMDGLQELLTESPGDTDLQLAVADTHNTIGHVLEETGELEQAAAHFRQEVDLKRALAASDTTNMNWRGRLATSHSYLGHALHTMGDLEGAMSHYREAVGIWSAMVAHDTTNVRWYRNLMADQQYVAGVLAASGDLAGALDILRSIEEGRALLVARDPTDPRWQRDEAETYVRSADVLRRLGRPEALGRAESAVSEIDRLLDATPNDPDLLLLRTAALNELGLARAARGDSRRARDAWAEAIRAIEPIAAGSSNPAYITVWARALLYLDRTNDALPLLERLEALGYREDDLADLAAGKGLETSLYARGRG